MPNLQRAVGALPKPLQRHALIKALVRVCPRLKLQQARFNQDGVALGDLRDAWFRQVFLSGEFEPEFFRICSPLVPDGGVVFDVGANFGLCSFGLLGMRPHSQLEFHLFEANPYLNRILTTSRRLHAKANVSVVHGCVSDQPGTSAISFDVSHTGGGRISHEGVRVPNVVLDSYIEAKNVQKIDFLKLDVEGWEPLALKGCQRTLQKGTVKTIYFEVSDENLQRAGQTAKQCISLLRDASYSLFWVKAHDFERFEFVRRGATLARVASGKQLRVAPLEEWPGNHQTDLLAVHDTCALEILSSSSA